MPNRKRPGEETESGHRMIEIAPGNRERTHQRTVRVGELRIRSLLPGDRAGLKEHELTHS
jgi:hypothetical protein